MVEIVGRKEEKRVLLEALNSGRPELMVIYGRRRIGKTFLIRKLYKDHLIFEFTGMYRASLKDQLYNFHSQIKEKLPSEEVRTKWLDAFKQLERFIEKNRSKKKKVIFIDEFPWIDTRRSNFLKAFDYFWNSYGSKQDNLLVVICGSAASYMVRNIIKSKGGLHNRLTRKIKLLPFTLRETEQLLRSNKVNLSRYEIIQIYMTMGGVPFYLEKIQVGESVPQLIDRLCFTKDGFLRGEFSNVFASLFDAYENHEDVVRVLAKVRKGLTRTDIMTRSKLTSGGRLTRTLEELEESGFIEKYNPYSGTNNGLYRLSDEYTLFYIKYIEGTRVSAHIWAKMQNKSSYKIWSGFSFETICIKHIEQIKKSLNIAGVHSVQGAWYQREAEGMGAQIDLIIDRDDGVINLCEMKFYNTKYVLTKKYAHDIAQKTNSFLESVQTNKSIFVTFISSFGLKANQYQSQYVQNELTLDALFSEL